MTKPSLLSDFVTYSAIEQLPTVGASHMPKVPPGSSYFLHTFPYTTSFFFTFKYLSFLANVSSLQELKSLSQASCHQEWVEAMNQELQASEQNYTWELITLPPEKNVIGCKWVYKIKLQPDGKVERYKAKIVAKSSSRH